jgi:thioredoxin-related protein
MTFGKGIMNTYLRLAALFFFVGISLLLSSTAQAQGSSAGSKSGLLPTPLAKKDLYPADADADKDITAAVQRASADKKRVLLVFGGNWCYDCHVLDRALHEGIAGQILKENFLLVHVDIGDGDKNKGLAKKYEIPLDKGVPAVAVLAKDGALLYSSGNGEFEAARTMMRKDLIAFLKHWREEN